MCKFTLPLATEPLAILSACFTTHDKWQSPELPRHEQHPFISGFSSSSRPSSRHIQQNAYVSFVSVLDVLTELIIWWELGNSLVLMDAPSMIDVDTEDGLLCLHPMIDVWDNILGGSQVDRKQWKYYEAVQVNLSNRFWREYFASVGGLVILLWHYLTDRAVGFGSYPILPLWA
jgi:hypothetical protein